MKKCNNCNQMLDDDAKFCPSCGNKIEENDQESDGLNQPITSNNDYSYYNQNNMNAAPISKHADASSFGFAVLSFFIPLVGLILFLTWKNDTPKKAKSCGIGALVGFICNIIFVICYVILIVSYLETAY